MIGRLAVTSGTRGPAGPAGTPDVSNDASRITGGTLSTARLNIAANSGSHKTSLGGLASGLGRGLNWGRFNTHARAFQPRLWMNSTDSTGRVWLLAAETVGSGVPTPPYMEK